MAQLRSSLFASVTEAAAQRTAVPPATCTVDLSFHLSRQTGALADGRARDEAVGVLLSTTVLQSSPPPSRCRSCRRSSPQLRRRVRGDDARDARAVLGVHLRRDALAHADPPRPEPRGDGGGAVVRRLAHQLRTVKYFDATAPRAPLRRLALDLPPAALKTAGSLALLNFGQSVIFSGGLAACLVLAAQEVAAGTMTIGDVVMVHGLVFQVSIPLNLLGMVYNQVRQSSTDMAALLKLLGETPAVASARRAAARRLGGRSASTASRSATPSRRRFLKGLSFDVPAGSTLAIVGGSGSASRRSCGCSTASTTRAPAAC